MIYQLRGYCSYSKLGANIDIRNAKQESVYKSCLFQRQKCTLGKDSHDPTVCSLQMG